jgi:hypothetical protein
MLAAGPAPLIVLPRCARGHPSCLARRSTHCRAQCPGGGAHPRAGAGPGVLQHRRGDLLPLRGAAHRQGARGVGHAAGHPPLRAPGERCGWCAAVQSSHHVALCQGFHREVPRATRLECRSGGHPFVRVRIVSRGPLLKSAVPADFVGEQRLCRGSHRSCPPPRRAQAAAR